MRTEPRLTQQKVPKPSEKSFQPEIFALRSRYKHLEPSEAHGTYEVALAGPDDSSADTTLAGFEVNLTFSASEFGAPAFVVAALACDLLALGRKRLVRLELP
jgi:hypothetical protein